ncbi:MAG TPA: alpha/beta hydrolase domain-containing protein [Polyangiales bacterium]|nr:alpha/beta hydrolase domain-containing protein [Polyangiales bacterium]
MYTPRIAASAVADPKVRGPIPVHVALGDPSRDYPQLAASIDLAARGYLEEEFFFEGEACNFWMPWFRTGSVFSGGHRFRSRMLVRRPRQASAFSGVVMVEWANVTSGCNIDVLWHVMQDYLMRAGHAYAVVSAQRVGIHAEAGGLRAWSPARYAELDVTAGGAIVDDSLCYDIFAQAAKAVGAPAGIDPLGGLPRERTVIAAGASQSAMRLQHHYNSLEPLQQLFDAYLLFLGLGLTFRQDLTPKLLKVNTENDVLLLREGASRQDDSDQLVTWEIAGASHVSYGSTVERTPLMRRDGLPVWEHTCERPAYSRVPAGYVLPAGFEHLLGWLRGGAPPPSMPRIELSKVGTDKEPSLAVRDARGNARGGIRLATMDAPIGTNTGVNSGPGFCGLWGSYEPFDAATLKALYPSHEAYVDAVRRVSEANVRSGVLLPPEAVRTVREAQDSDVGK